MKLSTSYVILLGKDPWKLAAGLLQTILGAFFFADFAWYPFLATNSHEFDYILGPMSHQNESGLGDPDPISFAKT